jgi:glucose-1-phosphate adenylyltransferase
MPRPRVLALLLAGGKGSRLQVLTEARAKPVLPFAGVYRLIDFALTNCVHSGIADVWVIEQFQPHALNDHLLNGRPWDLDRNTGGLRIMPPYTGNGADGGWAAGNADALYRNRRFIREFDPDLLLVLSADHVYALDYRDVLDAHVARAEAAVTMVTTEVPVEQATRFGVVQVGADGRVTDFAYKPERPAGGTVTAEVFVYDARLLLDRLDALGDAKRAEAAGGGDEGGAGGDEGEQASLKDFGDELLPTFVREGRAYAFPLPGYWRDLGTIDSYWEGHMDLLGAEPRLAFDDPAWPVLSARTPHPPARVSREARVDDGLLSPGCTVRGTVVESVLAPGAVVEAGATVRRAVLLEHAVVRAGAEVAYAVVDRRAEVGAGARVGDVAAAGAPLSEGHPPIAVVGGGARVGAGETVAPGACVEAEAGAEPEATAAGRVER